MALLFTATIALREPSFHGFLTGKFSFPFEPPRLPHVSQVAVYHCRNHTVSTSQAHSLIEAPPLSCTSLCAVTPLPSLIEELSLSSVLRSLGRPLMGTTAPPPLRSASTVCTHR